MNAETENWYFQGGKKAKFNVLLYLKMELKKIRRKNLCTTIITDLESISGIKQPHKTFKIEHSASIHNSEFYNTHIFFIILQHQINLIILFS